MNWIWDFNRDIWEQVNEYLTFITAEMEPAKQSWIRSQFVELSRLCADDSPPEHILLVQMLCSLHRHVKNRLVEIKPQSEIKTDTFCGRVDFYLETVVGNIVIECQGKRHIEPSVWAQDMKKARDIQNSGVTVLNFGSSEIYATADKCFAGEEIRALIDNRIERRKEWFRKDDIKYLIKEYIENEFGPMVLEYFKIKKSESLF